MPGRFRGMSIPESCTSASAAATTTHKPKHYSLSPLPNPTQGIFHPLATLHRYIQRSTKCACGDFPCIRAQVHVPMRGDISNIVGKRSCPKKCYQAWRYVAPHFDRGNTALTVERNTLGNCLTGDCGNKIHPLARLAAHWATAELPPANVVRKPISP